SAKDALARARRIAAENAREKIVQFLRGLKPAITAWEPSLEFIQATLLDGPTRQVSETYDADLKVTILKCNQAIARPDMETFRRLDREACRGTRVILLGKILALILFVLIAVAGYIRVDEGTGRAYTRWWGLLLIALLVAAGAGWWHLMSSS